ncbi:hydrolase [Actinoplanes sp. NPDC026670]|uniref:Vgb family protein n=1 Tax=Actinoplanes sp. NPDC026670 TaxID=3154700 RepID=UPI0033CE19ED
MNTYREVNLPEGWAPYAVAADASVVLCATILDPPGIARRLDGEIRHEPLDGRPMLLAVTPDGALWCTRSDDRLSRWDAGGGHTVIDVPAGSAPYGIAAAGDGGVWFTAPGLNRIGRITGTGELTMIDLPVADARAAMITVATDGTAWAALNGAGALARITGGVVEVVELPGGRAPAAPVGVAASPDGVWYADIAGGCVGLVDPSGAVEQITFDDPGCRPHAVAADPDGGCWVTLWGSGQLAYVTTKGDVTLRPLPGREPHGLCVSGTEVWVAMESGSLVAVDRREG